LTNELAYKLSAAEIIKSVTYLDLEKQEDIQRFKEQYKRFCNGNQKGIMQLQCQYDKQVMDALKIMEKSGKIINE